MTICALKTMTGASRRSRGQNVSESESCSVVVPSLEGPEGSLGLRGPWGLLAWRGRDFSKAPGEGAPEHSHLVLEHWPHERAALALSASSRCEQPNEEVFAVLHL